VSLMATSLGVVGVFVGRLPVARLSGTTPVLGLKKFMARLLEQDTEPLTLAPAKRPGVGGAVAGTHAPPMARAPVRPARPTTTTTG
jgi:hypothetical protein